MDDVVTTTNAIETLFKSVTTIITNILKWLGDVCTSLLSNPIFQITMGIAVLFIVMGIVFRLVRKMRKGGK